MQEDTGAEMLSLQLLQEGMKENSWKGATGLTAEVKGWQKGGAVTERPLRSDSKGGGERVIRHTEKQIHVSTNRDVEKKSCQ